MTEPKDYNIDQILLEPAQWQFDDYQKAKAQLYELITKEIIGEDEDLYFGKPHGLNDSFSFNTPASIRNESRAEQRTKLAHLFNIKENN